MELKLELAGAELGNTDEYLAKICKIGYCRVLTSVYEAATHTAQEKCKEKDLEYLPVWFLFSIVIMNGLLVSTVQI